MSFRLPLAAGILTLAFQSVLPLAQQFADIAHDVTGVVGVHAEVIETGDAAGINDDQAFPMQSVYKLPISMAILDQVDRRALTLTQKVHIGAKDLAPEGVHSPIRDAHPGGDIEMSVRDLVRAAIVDSDGTASDLLFHLGGDADRLTAYLRGIGVRHVTIATTEADMARDPLAQYRNSATPRDAVAVLKALDAGRGVSAAARQLLLKDVTVSTPGPKRLKGLLPPDTVVAHKTGTDGTHDGLTRATNDIGIVTLPNGRHLAIAVFVKDSRSDLDGREAAIANMARAAWDRWSGGSTK
jgi:beta-lactamase class A